ncbi:MAG: HNH endonuclease, partial [Actinomycetes bacterium]
MFESGLEGLGKAATAAAAVACHAGLVEREAELLRLAAHWADLHPGDLPDPGGPPGRERGLLLGGAGTPEVAEFAAGELGPLLETTTGSATHLMADALDLRHRLPRLWGRVRAGQVRAWKARRVAEATRYLPPVAAAAVDAAVAGCV